MPIGIKYLYIDDPDAPKPYGLGEPSITAQGMELLIRKDSEIKRLLLQAQPSIEDRKEFAQRIEALSPGLYARLGQVGRGQLSQGMQYIVDEVYEGNLDEVCEGGVIDYRN